jgi:AcrR family transcriptional regulator
MSASGRADDAGPAQRVSGAGGAGGASRAGRAGRAGRGGRRSGESGTKEAILDAARAQFAERGYHGATIRAIAGVAAVDPALVHHFYGTKEALFAAAMRLPIVPSEVLSAALARDAWAADFAGSGVAGSGPAGSGAAGLGLAGSGVASPGVAGSGVASPGVAGSGVAGPGVAGPGSGFGAHLVRTALGLWESDELRETFIGLLRSAVTSEQAAVMLREFLADSILSTVVRAAGLDERVSSAEAEFRAAMVATQMLGLAFTRLLLGLPPVANASVDDLAVTVGPTIERYLTGEIQLPRRSGQGAGKRG